MTTMPDPADPVTQPASGETTVQEAIEEVFDEAELHSDELAAMESLDVPRRALLVHAHPDDESIVTGLTMAHLAAANVGVTLVTCTRGEQGEIIGDHLELRDGEGAPDPEKLAQHRVEELATAMEALGVSDHRFLGGQQRRYRDSGMVWVRPGVAGPAPGAHPDALAIVDLDCAAMDLVAVLREVRPQVVITYEPGGGYGHPDHVRTHDLTMRAVELAADQRVKPGEPWQVARVFWVVKPESIAAHTSSLLRQAGVSEHRIAAAAAQERPSMVVPDAAVAVELHDPEQVAAKTAALRAHATQVVVDQGAFALSNDVWQPILSSEYFQLGFSQEPDLQRLNDLFQGVV